MIRITVLPAQATIAEGISRKTGKPYRIVRQPAVVQLSSGTHAFNIQGQRVNGRSEPYEPGNYTLAAESFYVKDGDLAFAPRLVAVAEARGGAK